MEELRKADEFIHELRNVDKFNEVCIHHMMRAVQLLEQYGRFCVATNLVEWFVMYAEWLTHKKVVIVGEPVNDFSCMCGSSTEVRIA